MVQTKHLVKTILEEKSVEKVNTQKPKKIRSKSQATAAKVALMKIKMNATGHKGIPDTEKIYAKLLLPISSSEKSKNVFFSNKWTIGKTVDYVADICKLSNENNVSSAKKLKLFELEEGQSFEFSSTVEECISKGLFYSGSTLLLEYVDTEISYLPDTQTYMSRT